jgi:hypothetical protein
MTQTVYLPAVPSTCSFRCRWIIFSSSQYSSPNGNQCSGSGFAAIGLFTCDATDWPMAGALCGHLYDSDESVGTVEISVGKQ